jgi:hypothetical protein
MLKGSVKFERKNIKTESNSVQYEFGKTPVIHNTVIQNSNIKQTFMYDENDWLLVVDGCGRQQYTSRKGTRKTAIKWGQLKLFTTELQFLNKYWNPETHPNPICVYVGAATGNHIYMLSKMFPQFQFHLYDGRNFDPRLEGQENIKIFVKLFTDTEVELYKNRDDVFFISDIRSLTYNTSEFESEETQRKNEEIAINDMKLQMDWVNKIQPVKAHIKFRLPYCYDWCKDAYFDYLDGEVYKQAFAPHTSTECRLVPDLTAPNRKWDYKVYEEMMFYHNNVVREHVKFANPLNNINEPISEELGLLQDFDSVVFVYTIKEYFEKFGQDVSNSQILSFCKKIIDDIGAGVVNLVNLRAGLSGTLSSTIKNRIAKMTVEDE